MTRPRLLLTRLWPEAALARLGQAYDVVVDPEDRPLAPAALTQAMADYDAIGATVTDRFDAELFARPAARVRIIGNFGVGHDHIDLAAARRANICVTNTPDVLTEATAELALTLMLMLSRRAGEGERMVRAGGWTGWGPATFLGQRLHGKLLGLVGFGRIGQHTARLAQAALGVRLAYASPRPVTPAPDLATATRLPLEALLAIADIVSLHCPGGPDTRHLIDAARLAAMKPGALLINTARGSIVDEAALAASLGSGRLGGAGLDVFAREPEVPAALRGLENVVLLPHLGSATVETRTAMGMRVADNLDAYFAGREPPDRLA